jgi:ADP-ribose pyrophosphatase YjhB (NUDIX family)
VEQIRHGDRIGKHGKVALGCCAVIFDASKQKVLLTRRADNNRWCLPGGHVQPGESVMETCIRKVNLETRLDVRVIRLIGVYSNPDRLIEYADGNRFHLISLSFEAEAMSDTLTLSDETTAYGYFSRDEVKHLDLMEHHVERVDDAFAAHPETYIR